jgi:ribonuclease III
MVHRNALEQDRGRVLSESETALAAAIGYHPREPALFVEALTHGSFGAKGGNAGGRDYQRLEFLGDRVLGLVIAGELYRRFPKENEGQLSARLNGLVTGEICAAIAQEIGLPPLIRLGKQARDDGGRGSANILGDVVEALIGALFLDGGIDEARRFILGRWGNRIDAVHQAPKHPKSALMEWAAANRRKPPAYSIVSRQGPDHSPVFTVEVAIPGVGEASAEGSNKQEAERAAAQALLAHVEARS